MVVLAFFLASTADAQIPIPARIGGFLTVNGKKVTHQEDPGYKFKVTRTDGTAFNPAAEDNNGLDASDIFLINIPLFHDETQPGGAAPGSSAIIHVTLEGKELTLESPANGAITVGQSGSIQQVDITAKIEASNQPPKANAGQDQMVSPANTVTLNGSGSSDPEGRALTYLWEQTQGDTVQLSNPASDKPTFTAPNVPAGTQKVLAFKLTVTDPEGLNNSDAVTITIKAAANQPPEADAGPDQTVNPRQTVTLNGANSSDPDGDGLMYLWEQTQGAAVQVSDSAHPQPTFTAPDAAAGVQMMLTFKLTITDPGGLKDSDSVNITVKSDTNRPPAANAGPDQTHVSGDRVRLDGSGSTDPDGGVLTYLWEQTEGPPVALSSPTDSMPEFTAPDVTAGTQAALVFRLTVTDPGGLKGVDAVTIKVQSGKIPPIANPGPNQIVSEGDTVILDGSNSTDPDSATDGIVSYQWIQTGGQTVGLSPVADGRTTFTAPNVGANGESLTFMLTVTDKDGLEGSNSVIVNVTSVNTPPRAVALAAPSVARKGETVTLDGSRSSDPDEGDRIVSYAWDQVSGPQVSITDAAKARASFIAPDISPNGETLKFELTVSDAGGLKHTDRVTVNVTSPENLPPRADAGEDQKVQGGDLVRLDGSASTDPVNGIVLYVWSQILGTPVRLSDSKSVSPTFTAPQVPQDVLIFELTVVGNGGLQDTARVIIEVSSGLRPPVADAGPDRTFDEGSTGVLDGSGSTAPDGTIVAYYWRQIEGPVVTLSNPSIVKPSFFVPAVEKSGVFMIFELMVTDNNGLKDTAQVIMTIRDFGKGPGDDGSSCFINTLTAF
jgi:hypothetical protein